jgi:hypothetical protein
MNPNLRTNGFLLSAWVVLVGMTFWLAAVTSAYLPKFDDWDMMVAALTGKQPITAAWLCRPHVTHCMPIAKLAYLAAFYLTGGDFRGPQLLSLVLMALAALAGMGLARRWRGSSQPADVFFPLLLLHWGQTQLYQQGAVLTFTIPLAISYGCLFLLLRSADLSPVRRATVLLATVAALAISGMVGQVMAVPYLILLGLMGLERLRESRREGLSFLAMSLGGAALVAFFVTGVPVAPFPAPSSETARAWPVSPEHLAVISAMSLGWLGRMCFVPSAIFVVGLSLATGLGLIHVMRKDPAERGRAAAIGAFMAGAALVLASIAYGRTAFTGEGLWSTTRYASVSVCLLVGAYLASFLLPQRALRAQSVLAVLAAVVFVGNLLGSKVYPYAHQTQLEVRAQEDALIRGVLSGKPFEQAAAEFFVHQNGYSPEQGAEWLRLLQDRRLGPFAMSERAKAEYFDWWTPEGEPLCLKLREASRYLDDGWCARGSGTGRWTACDKAGIRIRLDPAKRYELSLRMLPFVMPGKLDRQRVNVLWNGQPIGEFVLSEWTWSDHVVQLPAGGNRTENLLELATPDAASPKSIGYNDDPVPHAVMLQTIDVVERR